MEVNGVAGELSFRPAPAAVFDDGAGIGGQNRIARLAGGENGSVLTIYSLGPTALGEPALAEFVVRDAGVTGQHRRRGISVESPRQNFQAMFRSGICDAKPHPKSTVARATAARHTPFSLLSTTAGTNAFADAAPGRGLGFDLALGSTNIPLLRS
jgi:hypothetical protein